MKEFEVLQAIKNESSKNGKLAILKQGATEDLKKFLRYTMNRFITFRVNQIDMPEVYNVVQPNLFQEFFILCDLLASHTLGTNDAKRAIKNFLAKSTPEGAAWFAKCIKRDLDIGMDEKSVNKVFPQLIPVFDIQLAEPALEYMDKITFPCIAELKYNALRGVVLCDGTTVSFRSRKGFDFEEKYGLNLNFLRQQVLKLRPGTAFVLDTEFCPIKLNPNCKKAVAEFKAGSNNWSLSQANTMLKTKGIPEAEMKEYMQLVVFDIIDYDYFTTQGKAGRNLNLKERKIELAALFERQDRPLENIIESENFIVNSHKEIRQHFEYYKSQGLEGIMIKLLEYPYMFKRSWNVLKLKVFREMDLMVTGAEEGKAEGKYSGTLGALLLKGHTVTGKCGTGFSDNDGERDELWVEFLAGNLVGKIATVQVQEVSKDGVLQICSFVCIRDDKFGEDDINEEKA